MGAFREFSHDTDEVGQLECGVGVDMLAFCQVRDVGVHVNLVQGVAVKLFIHVVYVK